MTWKEVIEESNEVQGEAKADKAQLEKDAVQAEKNLADAMKGLNPAIDETAGALKAMNGAAEAEARYAATQSLIRGGLTALLQEDSSIDDAKKVFEETVSIRSFSVDDDGMLVETSEITTVGQVLGINVDAIDAITGKPSLDQLPKLAESLKDLPKLDMLKSLEFEHPGIATTIMGLGYDVARAEEQRIRAEISAAKSEFNVLKQQLALRTKQIDNLAKDSFVAAPGVLLDPFPPSSIDQPIGATLETYSMAGSDIKRRNTLTAAMVAILDNYESRVVMTRAVEGYRDRLSAIEVEKAMAITAANLHEREAVISRGLEGLVAFHRGGISKEDVANIMRLAQAVGIFAIAGGWL
jgi:hypothetical protein